MGATAQTASARTASAPAAPAKATAAPSSALSSGGSVPLRILKFFAALALIPLCVGLTLGTHEYFLSLSSRVSLAVFGAGSVMRWFVGGAGAFGLLAILLWRPIVVYVFAHELVHALATWLCLGSVSNLKASASGGQVTSSKTNTFIRLAPYCVPLYVLLAAIVYLALDRFWQPLSAYVNYLGCVMGFFYAFHLGFTLWSLRRDQPDLKPDGWLFSLVLIYMGNVLVFSAMLGFLTDPQPLGAWPALRESSELGWRHARGIYVHLGHAAEQFIPR